MGPEFEWQIGNDESQRIEVKTPPPRLPSTRQKIFVALAVFLGVCLGVVYVSIPELSKRPEPTPLHSLETGKLVWAEDNQAAHLLTRQIIP